MGKHERAIVEEAEKIAAILINNEKLSSAQEEHPFLELIKNFAKLIKLDYKNITKATAIGNSYDSPGDIVLNLKNGQKRYIELKFLEKSGFGTLANISQDALTLLNIYNCESWSFFREKTGHGEEVRRLLNMYKYEFGEIKLSDSNSRVSEAAAHLKKIINAGDRNVEGVCRDLLESSKSSKDEKKASQLILDIIKMDKLSRKKYLSILNKSEVNKERLKKFVILLLSGFHTQKALSVKMEKKLSLDKEDKNYDVYYLYKKTGQIVKEYGPEDLYKISSECFDVEIKEGETNLVIFLVDKKTRVNLIRVVFHWKNKFGGIETPCLNIFKF